MRDQIKKELNALALPPDDNKPLWLASAEDGVSFLKRHYARRDLILHASGPHMLIHAVLMPASSMDSADKSELMSTWIGRDESWHIERSWTGRPRVYSIRLSSPFEEGVLAGGEELVFRRRLSGVQKGPTPIELSQKLVHSLNLHFLPERNAYSRLDHRGDLDDVIKVDRIQGDVEQNDISVVTISADDLHQYMSLTGTVLFVRFDFTRFTLGNTGSWSNGTSVDEVDLHYNACRTEGHSSYANGFIVLRPNVTADDLIQKWQFEEEGVGRKYATFKFYDRKNSQLIETLCGPGHHVSYFDKSDLPWDISPAFFRPEVLHRFKADPDKFSLTDRSISCRNAWHLETYDINEAGQVHTYLIYLSRLPYEEQVYWQSFNEWPKTDISKRAFTTDILGQWDADYDPLMSIKMTARKLNERAPTWWIARSKELEDAVRYPATDSVAEWGNEVLALDHLVVEAFSVKALRKIATDNSVRVEKDWGSLKLLEVVLAGLGMSSDEVTQAIAPLRELHALRNPAKAHGDPVGREERVAAARKAYGTLRNHFIDLATRCDSALSRIVEALDPKKA